MRINQYNRAMQRAEYAVRFGVQANAQTILLHDTFSGVSIGFRIPREAVDSHHS